MPETVAASTSANVKQTVIAVIFVHELDPCAILVYGLYSPGLSNTRNTPVYMTRVDWNHLRDLY